MPAVAQKTGASSLLAILHAELEHAARDPEAPIPIEELDELLAGFRELPAGTPGARRGAALLCAVSVLAELAESQDNPAVASVLITDAALILELVQAAVAAHQARTP